MSRGGFDGTGRRHAAGRREISRQESTVSELSLAVEIREQTGKGVARRLRAGGRFPAVVYGHGKETVPIEVNAGEFDKLIKTGHAGLNTLFSLKGDARVEGRTVLVKELQREPLKGTVVHVDLYEVNLQESIRVSVPIRTVGTPVGVGLGGLLEHVMREIELDCLPTAIPDEIVVDVTDLDIGDTIHVSELDMPDAVEKHISDDLPVVSVVVAKVHELEEEEEAEEIEGEEAEAGEAGEAAAGEAEGKEGHQAKGKKEEKSRD
jgi:large subunit ribosomal protein L25